MTTILNPSSTPSVIYCSEGRTQESISTSAANIDGVTIPDTAPSIVQYAQTTAVVASSSVTAGGIVLPASAPIGSVVEAFVDYSSAHGILVYPASGDTIQNSNAAVGQINPGDSGRFQKVGMSDWRYRTDVL